MNAPLVSLQSKNTNNSKSELRFKQLIHDQGRSKGGGGVQVGPAHPRILLAYPRIKVKHIKNKIHLQYLSIICLWFKIWPTPAKNHCYALVRDL
jgi:hypothetical protein